MDQQPDVLQLVLHNASARETLARAPASVCSLLSASSDTAAAVEAELSGRVDVCAKPTTGAAVNLFRRWLARRGRLLRSLAFEPQMAWQLDLRHHYGYEELDTPPSLGGEPDEGEEERSEDNAAAGHMLALALLLAEDELGGLRSFSCNKPDASPQLWLQSLPNSLTQLKMSWLSDTSAWWGLSEQAWLAPLAENLARLTGLRSLHLTVEDVDDSAGRMDWVVPGVVHAIEPLTALTELVLAGLVWGTENGGYADEVPLLFWPDSGLQRLIFPGRFSRCVDTIAWGALTSLTELHLEYDIGSWGGDDDEESALPPNLVRLTGAGWGNSQPLGLLTRLTKLQHIDGVFSAEEVAALAAAAPGLAHVLLRVGVGSKAEVAKSVADADAGAAHAVAGVLLEGSRPQQARADRAGRPRLGAAQLQPLTALSRLTALAVKGCKVGNGFTAALSTLRGLAAVSLPDAASVPAGYAPLSLACELPEGV